MPDQRVLLVIPVYNEACTVAGVVRRARDMLPGATVLVVDDGSIDGTGRRASAAGAKVVRLPYNLGIGAAAQTGQLYALNHGFDVMVRLDGDAQHSPDDIPRLLEPLERGEADYVIGSRFASENDYRVPFSRWMGIRFFSLLLMLICRRRLTDTTSGFVAATRLAVAHLAGMVTFDYPEVESIVSLHKAGFRIVEVPVQMAPRTTGRSSINLLRGVYYAAKVFLAVLVGFMAGPRRPRRELLTFLEDSDNGGIAP